MSKTPNYTHFNLKRVELLKNGGLAVEYSMQEQLGGDTYLKEFAVKDPRDPHPDLMACFSKCESILALTWGFHDLMSLINSDGFKATPEQKKQAEKAHSLQVQSIDAKSISLSGKDKMRGAIISGAKTTESGNVAINSPRVVFDRNSFGIEEDLEEIIDTLQSEVFDYLYKGKGAQLQIFAESA